MQCILEFVHRRTGTLVARYVFTMYVILYVCSLSMYNHLFRWLSLAAMATVAVEAIISYVCNILIYVKSTTNTRRFDLKHLLFHYMLLFLLFMSVSISCLFYFSSLFCMLNWMMIQATYIWYIATVHFHSNNERLLISRGYWFQNLV